MESGRVGSSWLVALLRNHTKIISCKEESLASSHAGNRSWYNLVSYYNHTMPFGTAIGAKQKQVALVNKFLLHDNKNLLDHIIDDFGVRIICLARSNPVESHFAEINGEAHQSACHAHIHRDSDSAGCYSDDDAKRLFSRYIWKHHNFTLNPRLICTIHSHLIRTLRFFQVCNRLAEEHRTRIFWVEYSDLSCHFEPTMRAILKFLELPYEYLWVDNITKLTQQPRYLIPRFEDLVQALEDDEFIKFGALSSALLSADNCEYANKHQEDTLSFCPLIEST